MRRKKLWLSVATLTLLTAQMLTACERAVPDRGIYQPEPEEEPTQKPTPTQEPEPETPTSAAAASGAGLALDASEIEYINEYITVDYNGFFLCDYCCPEMIDWGCVLYNGAGIDRDLTDEEYDDYTSEYGEVMTGITAIDEDAYAAYIEKTTESDIAHIIKGLDWDYLYRYRLYCSAHGDTNYMPITVTGGEKNGDIYTIEYNKTDPVDLVEKDYVLTAKADNGDWKFISNLPKEYPSQKVLADIDFFNTWEEVVPFDPYDSYVVDQLESDEPGTYWMLVTAKEDQTLITLNRADISDDYKETLIWDNIYLPGEELYFAELDAGQSIAVCTNLPWSPRIHMSVGSSNMRGEYWFGQDNWRYNYLEDGFMDHTVVVGEDYTAQTDPVNIVQYLNMLKGRWVLFDKYGDLHYTFYFDEQDTNSLNIESRYDYFKITSNAAFIDDTHSEVPDGLALQIFDDIPKDKLGNYDTTTNTYYKVDVMDLGDERVLTLTAADTNRDLLSYLCHNCGDDGVYILHRYR